MVQTFGAAYDKVRSFDAVTGDDVLRHVAVHSEPDLFWGLRGGKVSLGIITSMEFELLPLPLIYAGTLFCPRLPPSPRLTQGTACVGAMVPHASAGRRS